MLYLKYDAVNLGMKEELTDRGLWLLRGKMRKDWGLGLVDTNNYI